MLLPIDRMTIYGGIFALVGAALDIGAFVVGIASSGLKAVPMPWAIVSYLADWPYMILLLLMPIVSWTLCSIRFQCSISFF